LVKALEKLGKRIRAAREDGELTQEDAADGAELSAKHWQDIESGRTNPTFASLLAVARSLGVPLSQLVEKL
jgi:transcriptional regulator with XRE-family HTH domain